MKILFLLISFLTLLMPLHLGASERSDKTEVIVHSDDLTRALKNHNFDEARILLGRRSSQKIEIFNLIVRPFYELYINWDFAEAKKIKEELNVTYGEVVNLGDYNELFDETYQHVSTFEPSDENKLLATQAFAGTGSEDSQSVLLDICMRLARGASFALDYPISKERIDAIVLQSSENENNIIEAAPEEVAASKVNAEISATPPIEAETTEELPTSKLEVKEAAEVKPVEVAEETPEQPSQRWLWLIGAAVVVCGLGLVLRRKS